MRRLALTLAGAAAVTIAAISSASAQTNGDCVNGYRNSGGITVACRGDFSLLPGAFPGRPPHHEPVITGSISTYDEPMTTGSIRRHDEPIITGSIGAPVHHRILAVGSSRDCAPGEYWMIDNPSGGVWVACR